MMKTNKLIISVIAIATLTSCALHQKPDNVIPVEHHDVIINDLVITWDKCNNTSAINLIHDDAFLEQQLRQMGYMIFKKENPNVPVLGYNEIYVEKNGSGVQLLATLQEQTCTVSRTYLVNGSYLTPLSNKNVRR